MDISEIRKKARQLAKGSCRVCPVCDGQACAGEVPGMGGAGSGASFLANLAALAKLRLNTRLIHEVRDPVLQTNILGLDLAMPLIIGPVGGISFNMGAAMEEAEYQKAIVLGAAEAGIIAGTPDAAVKEVMEIGLECAKKVKGRALPFVKPWEIKDIEAILTQIAEAGCPVAACDLDSIGLITLRKMGRPAYAKNQQELQQIVKIAHGLNLKLIIKGIMTTDDALTCRDIGVDGLVVSNHGGRVLDWTPGTAEVLPKIAKAVGEAMTILVDGGIRSGVDILKMLALGADAVFIARPYMVAAVGGALEGVKLYTQNYRSQLEQAMIMTGCAGVAEAGLHLLHA